MNNSLNAYPVFEDNQVLTSTQLNELASYLDEQNRLTRANLLGTGIACGLTLKYTVLSGTGSSALVSISLRSGGGVTSQGFTMNVGDCDLVQKRTYTLPSGVDYPHFSSFTSPIYEVLTVNAEVLSTDNATPITAANCQDRVLVLFLETVDVDLNSCLGKACDENGLERVFNLRKLLITKDDLNDMKSDYPDSPVPFVSKFTMPEIIMKRPLLDVKNPNWYNTMANISAIFRNTVSANFNNPTNNKTYYTTIFETLSQTYQIFQPILGKEYNNTNPFTSGPLASWNDFVGNGSSLIGPSHLGVQYFADFINDLVLAYNEFRAYAMELLEDCCADPTAFPLHLMVGEATGISPTEGSLYRHYFKPSPVLNGQSTKTEAAIFYHKRLVMLYHQFNFSLINNPYNNNRPVKITPTIQNTGKLSKRAIPYYYNANTADSSLGGLKLLDLWSYDYKVKGLLKKGIKPYSYELQITTADNAATAYDATTLSTSSMVHLAPLFYDINAYDAFRVEGHLGIAAGTAKTKIEAIRDKFDLPFSVLKLRLTGTLSDAEVKTLLNIDDLRADYGAQRAEIISLLEDLKNGLRKNYNQNPDLDLPQFVLDLLGSLDSNGLHASARQPQIDYGTTQNQSPVTIDIGNVPGQIFGFEGTLDFSSFVALTGNNTASNYSISVNGPIYQTARSITTLREDYNSDVNLLMSAIDSLLNNTNYSLPFNITDLDIAVFTSKMMDAIRYGIKVKVGLNQLVDSIIHNTMLKTSPELFASLNGYLREIFALLERLIKDNVYKAIRFTYYTYKYRFDFLKSSSNDLSIFTNFIAKHPGFNHNGTVPRGGTLLLLSNGTSVNGGNGFTVGADDVIMDFSLPYRVDQACLCQLIPPITSSTQIAIPDPVAPPFYVEYSSGDYAFTTNAEVSMHKEVNTSSYMTINVLNGLNYGSLSGGQKIKLYVLHPDENGILVKADTNSLPLSSIHVTGGYKVSVPVTTTNVCNTPTNTTGYGEVVVKSSDTAGLNYNAFGYVPNDQTNFTGVDSFYYMYEIVNSNGSVAKRSNVGTITIHVDTD